ncbi:MAG TPA: ATP-binding protein [Sedimenticola sp.]|nr:ATP-binding protein [Sedimenticola sp.]
MLFIMGPRQVGKTTTCRDVCSESGNNRYFNWDNQNDRQLILRGPEHIAAAMGLDRQLEENPIAVFDELRKYGRWKGFLKGWFDTYEAEVRTLVTGSARLDVYKAGGDSLMGRYFSYRMHPLSIAELLDPTAAPASLYRRPKKIDDDLFDSLFRYGGFPEPLIRQEMSFHRRWQKLRSQQLLREDLRDLTRIQELGQVEVLARLIQQRCGQLTSYSSLASQLNASVNSVKRWLDTLQSLYYCFAIRPWFKNVTRSLRKEPIYFLWDWSELSDQGARAENFIASALLKAVHYWTDAGLGEFDLHFLRDKQKHEVDFLVSRDGNPWFLVEAKYSGKAKLSDNLSYFQQQLKVRHAFQAAIDLPWVEQDCFELQRPKIVSARTLLSQLV